mgnify:CR=1 FL=1
MLFICQFYFLAFDEQSRDADLMADSLLERKCRFLCITRVYPLAGNQANILEDIKLSSDLLKFDNMPNL